MNWDDVVVLINFLSRWILFGVAAYKACSERNKGWLLLTGAFFIMALDIESSILEILGIKIPQDVYRVAFQIPMMLVTVLMLWGALHIKYEGTSFKHTEYLLVYILAAYIWSFLSAAGLLGESLGVNFLFPMLAGGASLIYLGWVLKNYEIGSGKVESLFPWGLILLGALNLTYPVTRFIDWFAPIGFALGGLFRLMAAIGAINFVLFSVREVQTSHSPEINPGAYILPNGDKADKLFSLVKSQPGTVLITREEPTALIEKIPRESLVFWITRVKEGKLQDSPTVYAISPTKIDILIDYVARALRSGYHTIYIDAFEYLVLENGFENVLKFLLNVKDRVIEQRGTMFLVVDVRTLTEKQRKILEKEFQSLK